MYLPSILPKLFLHKLLQLNDQDSLGKTALHYACQRHNPLSQSRVVPEYLNVLIHNSAVELDAADANGLTPLMIVAARGDKLIAEELINAGANPACIDK